MELVALAKCLGLLSRGGVDWHVALCVSVAISGAKKLGRCCFSPAKKRCCFSPASFFPDARQPAAMTTTRMTEGGWYVWTEGEWKPLFANMQQALTSSAVQFARARELAREVASASTQHAGGDEPQHPVVLTFACPVREGHEAEDMRSYYRFTLGDDEWWGWRERVYRREFLGQELSGLQQEVVVKTSWFRWWDDDEWPQPMDEEGEAAKGDESSEGEESEDGEMFEVLHRFRFVAVDLSSSSSAQAFASRAQVSPSRL